MSDLLALILLFIAVTNNYSSARVCLVLDVSNNDLISLPYGRLPRVLHLLVVVVLLVAQVALLGRLRRVVLTLGNLKGRDSK